MSTFKFISEKPQKGELGFGHAQILKALKSIITSCSTPFTIGLYGKWGSGKSSIAESLQDQLHNSGIPVILFDVWKHEGDALRRTFLKEIVRQLQSTPYGPDFFYSKFKLSERVDSSYEQKQQKKIKLEWQTLKPILQLSIVISIIPVTVFLIAGYFVMKEAPWLSTAFQNLMASILSISTLGLFVKWIFESAKDFTSKSEITISHDKLTDPHDFEDEFKRILTHLSNSRVVIIFDNLDRVSGESALSIISTIKTFLEPIDRAIESKDVIFLVPCDVSAIKKHLKKVMRGEVEVNGFDNSELDNYADEFLRKFFNTILWIPEFYSIELEQFAHQKLKETQIAELDNDHLSWLIIRVFQQNPRQIIQFINILISNYLVLKQKSIEGAFGDKEFFNRNVPQLAKYLLLVQKFPAALEKYKASKTYNLSEEVLTTNDPTKSDFDNFRKETSDIVIESLEPFFTFKISEQEQQIPGVMKVLLLMDNNSVEEALNAAKDLKLSERVREFSAIVQNYLSSKRNSVIICSFVNSLLHITKTHQITLEQSAYRQIQTSISNTDLSGLDKIDAELLQGEFFENSKSKMVLRKDFVQSIVTQWTFILRNRARVNSDLLQKIFRQALSKTEFMDSGAIESIQLATNDFVNNSEFVSILLQQNSNVQKKVITGSFMVRLFEELKLSSTDNESFKRLTERVNEIEAISEDAKNLIPDGDFTRKILDIFQIAYDLKELEQKNMVNGLIRKIIRSYANKIKNSPDPSLYEQLSSVVTSHYNNGRWSHCHLVIPIILDLENFELEPLSSRMRKLRIEFFSNLNSISSSNLNQLLVSVPSPELYLETPECAPHVDNAIANLPDHFFALYKFASSNSRAKWLTRLINEGKITWIKDSFDEILKVGIPSKESFSEVMITRMRNVGDINEWNISSGLLERLSLSQDEIKLPLLRELIISKLQSPDSSIQKIGKEYFGTTKYLEQKDKVLIISTLITWLKETPNPYQPLVFDAITSLMELVPNQSKKEYVDLLLERMILNSDNQEWIDGSLNNLVSMQFSRGDHLIILKQIVEKMRRLKSANPGLSSALASVIKSLTQDAEEEIVELRDQAIADWP